MTGPGYKFYSNGKAYRIHDKLCLQCKNPFTTVDKEGKFCDTICSGRYTSRKGLMTGSNNPAWKGGRSRTSMGYIRIWKPEHPRASKGGYVPEHTLVLEEKLGRFLHEDEIAHHINGVKDDNRPENLKVTTVTEHKKHHGLQVPNAIKGKKYFQVKEPVLTGSIPDQERFTVLEVAKLTGIGNSTMWKKVWNSEIDSFLDGRRRFVTRNALEVFVA